MIHWEYVLPSMTPSLQNRERFVTISDPYSVCLGTNIYVVMSVYVYVYICKYIHLHLSECMHVFMNVHEFSCICPCI